jgi:FlaA1/EpsC-like NDP-sugar epimerase
LRRSTLAAWDVACWAVAAAVVVGVRLDFTLYKFQWNSVLLYWVTVAALVLGIGYATKYYRGRFRIGSFDDALGLALLFGATAGITVVTMPFLNPSLPRSLLVLVPPLALLGAAVGRWCYRSWRDRQVGSTDHDTTNVLIYGAGDACYQLLRLLRSENDPRYSVVGLIDDNPAKRHLRLQGVPVLGGIEMLAGAAESTSAEAVILAVPSADGAMVARTQESVEALGLEFLVVPALSELIGGRIGLDQIRRVEIGDILGRHPVQTEVAEIAQYLIGRRVLITGAGGSIGAELARQVHRFGPARLVLLDRDESALHAVQLSIYGQGLLNDNETELADIRDVEALSEVFARHRPEIVFHAAALKHLPLLERFPQEGWKTNVIGTLNVLQLAEQYGVSRLVNISTDKAADATSVLGRTKRLAERLTAWQAERSHRPYMSVRFGNVLGSRGSMLPTFTSQIANGGPVTVTHPDVTRYFMTIPEACELVIQSGAIGQAGEVMVLDMGTPVRILDVAKRMIALSGQKVDIVFTGLREGEKIHETLFSDIEMPRATPHPLIRGVNVPPIAPEYLTGHASDDVQVDR